MSRAATSAFGVQLRSSTARRELIRKLHFPYQFTGVNRTAATDTNGFLSSRRPRDFAQSKIVSIRLRIRFAVSGLGGPNRLKHFANVHGIDVLHRQSTDDRIGITRQWIP
jgi:hypothetical protein